MQANELLTDTFSPISCHWSLSKLLKTSENLCFPHFFKKVTWKNWPDMA